MSWVTDHQSEYPDGFFKWLELNMPIWYEFEEHARRMARRRKRYSARTIIEVLRWNSDLHDTTVEFKISNNFTPGLARLWMAKYGKRHPGFFALHNATGNDDG